jgi:MOSC domain-containing protein YiiM
VTVADPHIHQLNASGGGVPKEPVLFGEIGRRGLAGDRQREVRLHGAPWQALSLWSLEVIEALQADGHPIRPGAAGENVTVARLDWAAMAPGVQLRLGDQVLVEITAYATPCKKNAQWFSDGDFKRVLHDRNPGTSRLYAAVLETGTIAPGDPVEVVRAEAGARLDRDALNERWPA